LGEEFGFAGPVLANLFSSTG